MHDDETRAGRPRDPGRDAAILEATLDLLGEVGYEKVTVRAIAGRAGAGLATLYRRWPTKDDLVVDAVAGYRQPSLDTASASSAEPVDVVVDLVTAFLDTLQGERTRGLIPNLIGQLPHNPELAATLRARVVLPRLDALAAQFRRLPGVDDARARAAAEQVPASLFFQVLVLGRRLGEDDVRALVETVVAPLGARAKG